MDVQRWTTIILEYYVIPHLKASEISEQKQRDVVAMFEEQICRSLTNCGEYVGMCADIILSQIETATDIKMLDRFLARAKTTYDQLEEYISNGRTYFTDILIKGHDIEKCDGEYLPKDQLHFYAVQRNLKRLRNRLLIEESNILHRLVAGDVFTEEDKDSIIDKPNRREKNDEFLKRLCDKCNSEQFTNIVLPAFKEDHPHLEELLQETLHKLSNNPEQKDPDVCGFCFVQGSVEPSRLADYLLENKAISRNLHTDLRNAQLPITVKWTVLLEKVENYSVLEQALKLEYPAVVDRVIRNGGITKECVCSHIDRDGHLSNDYQARSVLFASHPQSDIACLSDVESMLGDVKVCSRSSISGDTEGSQQKNLVERKRSLPLISETVKEEIRPDHTHLLERGHQQRGTDRQLNKSSNSIVPMSNKTTTSHVADKMSTAVWQEDTLCSVCGVPLTNPQICESAFALSTCGEKNIQKKSQPSLSSIAQQLVCSSISPEAVHTHRQTEEHKKKSLQFYRFIKIYTEDRMRHLSCEVSLFIDLYELRNPKMRQTCYANVSKDIQCLLTKMDHLKTVLENMMNTYRWEYTEQLQQAVFSLYEDYRNRRFHISRVFIHYQECLKGKDKVSMMDIQHDSTSSARNCSGACTGGQRHGACSSGRASATASSKRPYSSLF